MTADDVIEQLRSGGIAFRTATLTPGAAPADAAAALDLPLAAVCKTLAVASMPAVVLVVLPVEARLDLAALREHLGENRTMLIDAKALERMTGFRPGAVTPLPRPGQRRFRVIVDTGILTLPEVSVGGGTPGVEVAMAPHCLVRVCNAEMAAVIELAE